MNLAYKNKSHDDYRYKHPVFDGEKPKEFKDWWDNIYATLEMDDIEEYVTNDWSNVHMPTKLQTELSTNDTYAKGVELANKKQDHQERDEESEGLYG